MKIGYRFGDYNEKLFFDKLENFRKLEGKPISACYGQDYRIINNLFVTMLYGALTFN